MSVSIEKEHPMHFFAEGIGPMVWTAWTMGQKQTPYITR